MGAAAEAIRRGRKFDQVLDGARTIFLRDGYEGASVDDIAREAGVSKATLYSYFPDKRLLFLEFAKLDCRRQAEEAAAQINMNRPVDQILLDAARSIARFKLSDFGMRVFRVCVAEAERFPQVAREFYEFGPALVRDKIAEVLRCGVGRGELAVDDIALAADQFADLSMSGLFHRAVFGIGDGLSPEDVERTAQAAVRTFMARYGATA